MPARVFIIFNPRIERTFIGCVITQVIVGDHRTITSFNDKTDLVNSTSLNTVCKYRKPPRPNSQSGPESTCRNLRFDSDKYSYSVEVVSTMK